ncbi:MAG: hypothetical protein V7645_1299, partial [Actinomycetota bacterium]
PIDLDAQKPRETPVPECSKGGEIQLHE